MKKKVFEKTKKIILGFVPSLPLFYTPLVCNAGGLQSTKLIQGVNKLLQDGATALCFLEVAVLGILLIVEGIGWQKGEPEEAPKHKKKMLSMVGIGALIICSTALVPVIFSYFQ